MIRPAATVGKHQWLVDGELMGIAMYCQNWHAQFGTFIGQHGFEVTVGGGAPIDIIPARIAMEQYHQPLGANILHFLIGAL